MRLPFSMVKNFSPSNCWLVGMAFLSRVRILFWERSSSSSDSGFHHVDAGIEQECAEKVENPFELLYQCRADEDHDGAQDDGAEYAIE